MLDYETHNDSTIVHWSNDGNSFIVTDKNKFEAVSITLLASITAFVAHMTYYLLIMLFSIFVFRQDIYPTYFDSRIIFATFLSKLYRWGFSRLSTKSGSYEFRSPTFTRLASDSAPAAPAAAAAADTSSKAGGGASIPVQQQHQTQAASTLQQVIAQTNQPPAHNPLPSQVNRIADLFSNIQRNSQQPSLSSQQFVMNRVLNTNLFHQQPFQQLQHPNPTTNLLTAALSILAGNQAPSAPLIDYSPVCHQGDAIQTLMSLYGMSSSHANGTFPNTNTTPAISQPDNAVQSLLMQIHRVSEDERQRRAKADSVQNAINASIGQIFGASNTIDEAERQRGLLAAALGQTLLGSTGEATTPNVPLATHLTGTTLPVPYIAAAGQMQQGIPPPSAAGSLNFQAHPIAAILQAARRPDDDDGNDEGKDDRPLSLGKRKSRDDGYSNNSRRKKK
jgi:hypothetical protein